MVVEVVGSSFGIAPNVIRLAEVAKKQSLIFDFAKTLQTQKQF
jgi:hypothetical protein